MRFGILSRITAVALAATQPLPALASDGTDLFELDLATLMTIHVGTSADASAKGLSTPFVGNQVADGGRLGILGTKTIMETPFSTTHYT